MHLSKNGIQPASSKVKAVKDFKEPKNPTEVRSFLGFVTFVSRFIPRLADIALPLRRLTQKNREWRWSTEEQQSFAKIKELVTKETTLVFFDTKLHTELVVDASPAGVGAILSQIQQDGKVRPVAYASRALTAVETRYSQTEREALSIKYGCLKFFHYLSGDSGFTVVTDHKPLVEMFKPHARPPPRIERMALRIQDLRFQVVYRTGANNPSDILSRQPLNENNCAFQELKQPSLDLL